MESDKGEQWKARALELDGGLTKALDKIQELRAEIAAKDENEKALAQSVVDACRAAGIYPDGPAPAWGGHTGAVYRALGQVAALGSPERLFPHGVREWRGHVEFERLAQLEDRLLQFEALVYRRTPGETSDKETAK